MRSKEERERDIIEFWKILGEYDNSLPKKQDPPEPDHYADTKDGLIGIEHTSLVHPRDANGINIVVHNAKAHKIVNNAWKKFKADSDVKLHVGVSFRCDYRLNVHGEPVWLSKQDEEPLSDFLKDFVSSNYPKDPGKDIVFGPYHSDLPEKIDSILISNTHEMGMEAWSADTGGTVPFLLSDFIQERIDEKNEKPSNYNRDYITIWLVLVENTQNYETYFRIDDSDFETKSYRSNFDRTYLYRKVQKDIIELSTS